MLRAGCTCQPLPQGQRAAAYISCAACGARNNLESWTMFLEDFRRKNPLANIEDEILLEVLNVQWLHEAKPEIWSEATSRVYEVATTG